MFYILCRRNFQTCMATFTISASLFLSISRSFEWYNLHRHRHWNSWLKDSLYLERQISLEKLATNLDANFSKFSESSNNVNLFVIFALNYLIVALYLSVSQSQSQSLSLFPSLSPSPPLPQLL